MKRRNTKATVAVLVAVAGMVAGMLAAAGEAKKKEKGTLPAAVLNAKTVVVVILPEAGEPIRDPSANRRMQEDVEKALLKWGRFQLALDVNSADLVIGVKHGNDQPVTATVGGGPVDGRPVTIEQTPDTIRIGGAQGRPTSDASQVGIPGGPDGRPTTGAETGTEQDVFNVYLGGVKHPMDSAPVWSFLAKDGLKAPRIVAVEEFHKAINEAEKAAQKKQQGQSAKKSL